MRRGLRGQVAPELSTSGGLRVQSLRVRSEQRHMYLAGPSFEHTEQRPLDTAALPLRGRSGGVATRRSRRWVAACRPIGEDRPSHRVTASEPTGRGTPNRRWLCPVCPRPSLLGSRRRSSPLCWLRAGPLSSPASARLRSPSATTSRRSSWSTTRRGTAKASPKAGRQPAEEPRRRLRKPLSAVAW
jgi:hypothetical protein